MKILRWSLVVALFAVGIGAVVISTGTLDGTRAATSDLITATATRADVSKSAAATGTVTAADTYSLGFGVDPTAGAELAMTLRPDMGRRRRPRRRR